MSNSDAARAAVVAEARRWVGTPYHSNADILGVGVDCGMLLVRAFVDAGIVPPFDPRPYPRDWHLHRSEERYLSFVTRFGKEIQEGDLGLGDVATFRIGRCYAHGGIVVALNPARILHAYAPSGRTLEDDVAAMTALSGFPVRFFSAWA